MLFTYFTQCIKKQIKKILNIKNNIDKDKDGAVNLSTDKDMGDESIHNLMHYNVQFGQFTLSSKKINALEKYIFLIFICCIVATIMLLIKYNSDNRQRSLKLENSSQILMHAQRLAKSSSIIILKDINAYQNSQNIWQEINESQAKVEQNLASLKQNSNILGRLNLEDKVRMIEKKWYKTREAIHQINLSKDIITQTNVDYTEIKKHTPAFLNGIENLHKFIQQNNIREEENNTKNKEIDRDRDMDNMLLFSHRLIYNVNMLRILEEKTQDNVFNIKKDVLQIDSMMQTFHLNPKYQLIQEELSYLNKIFNYHIRTGVMSIINNMPSLLNVQKNQQIIITDSEDLRQELANLQQQFSMQLMPKLSNTKWLWACATMSLISLVLLLIILHKNNKSRVLLARKHQQEAENQQKIEQHKNTTNQQAIQHLMTELEDIANGDLTKKAKVDTSITGVIADFINYTVEELKNLVQHVQSVAQQATYAFGTVQKTSIDLLDTTNQQSKQIDASVDNIKNIAKNMQNLVARSNQAVIAATDVASVTQKGQESSQNVVLAMHGISLQIQETSKQIKYLGESSLQISEITHLIESISQQTHILAINSAIQAANAGQAGQGFGVIAQEIQNLAEKSTKATQDISQLIANIQSNVQNATMATENCVKKVVDGKKMTCAMEDILLKIQQSNTKMVENIQEFSKNIDIESQTAENISMNVKELLQLTEKTLAGTAESNKSIHHLNNFMQKLEQSVARFTVN